MEGTEQLKRYRSTFPNLILADFCKFRLYRDENLILSGRLATPSEESARRSEADVEDTVADRDGEVGRLHVRRVGEGVNGGSRVLLGNAPTPARSPPVS